MKRVTLLLACLLRLAVATHWAPSLQGMDLDHDDGIVAYWTIDINFYPDAEAPDGTYITLQNIIQPDISTDNYKATIPKKTWEQYAGSNLVVGVMFYWTDSSGTITDHASAPFDGIFIPTKPGEKPNPPPKPYSMSKPTNLMVTMYENHRVHFSWVNHPAPNTNAYGKILVLIQEEGAESVQPEIGGAETSYVWGPVHPNKKYLFSVEGGNSYTWGYQYTNWTTIAWKSPNDGDPIVGWHPWFPINPNQQDGFVPGSQVTALWSRSDHLDLFAIDTAGGVRTTYWDPTNGWQQTWWNVGNWVGAAPGTQVTAVWRDNHQHLDLFVMGKDCIVYSIPWENGWGFWFPIHNESTMACGAPITAVWRPDNSQIDIYVTDQNGGIHSAWWDKLWHGWVGWNTVPSNTAFNPGTYITAVNKDNDRTDLFAVDNMGFMRHTHTTPHRQPPVWTYMNPSVDKWNFTPGTRVNAMWVRAWGREYMHLTATAMDGTIWQSSWDWNDAHDLAAWTQISGQFNPGTEVVMTNNANPSRVFIWGIGEDQRIYHDLEYQDTSWFAWDRIRYFDQMSPNSKLMPLFSEFDGQKTGHYDMFVVGKDGNVWSTWYSDGYFE